MTAPREMTGIFGANYEFADTIRMCEARVTLPRDIGSDDEADGVGAFRISGSATPASSPPFARQMGERIGVRARAAKISLRSKEPRGERVDLALGPLDKSPRDARMSSAV